MTVVECDTCRLCFINPRPKAEIISRLYGHEYFVKLTNANRLGYTDYFSEEFRRTMLMLSQMRLEAVADLVGELPFRCLEVGCSTGEFCWTLTKRGLTAVGLDLADSAIAVARRRYPGLEFACGDIETLKGVAPFDAIFAFEVIEHVPSPRRFLRAVADRLRSGGLCVITTPNVRCANMVGVHRWTGFLMSFEHLYFLSPETLGAYGQQEGFETVGWLTHGGTGWFRRECRRFVREALLGG